MRSNEAKRLLDVAGSAVGIAVLSPLFVLLAVAVRTSMGPPVLFRQERTGLGGRPFILYKFRTMDEVRTKDGAPLPDAIRLTQLGRWLRRWSMDEFPELFNVLKGDMSLVGPRPLLPQYLARYSRDQARRHEVKPGLTGWAQIHGRNAITWEEKFSLDVWYVDHRSWWLDLKIMIATVGKVVRGEGIGAPGDDTMPEFMGTENSEHEEHGGG